MIQENLAAVFRQTWGNVQVSAFAPLLGDQDIIQACRQLGHVWRHSPFPPAASVRSLLFRAAHPDQSILNTVEHLVAQNALKRAISPSAWSQARDRLPQDLLPILIGQTAQRAIQEFPCRWHGRDVYLVDGSTVSMSDEPPLATTFGYSDGRHNHSRFPLGRILAVLHAGSGVIAQYRLASYRTSELEMFREILPSIPRGSLSVSDRFFSGFPVLAASLDNGVDFVTRLNQRRDAQTLIQAGKRLAPNEWLVPLRTSRQVRAKYAPRQLPETILVRLIRHRYQHLGQPKTLWLITSLLDRQESPREDIVSLYLDRWGIETHYAYLKVTLQMAVLRSRTVANIHREVAAIVLVHNLLWHLVCRAAQQAGVSPNRISFAATVKTVLAFCPTLALAAPGQRPHLYQQMLQRIARHVTPHRPDRHEPRLVKRDQNRYGALRVPRAEARRVG